MKREMRKVNKNYKNFILASSHFTFLVSQFKERSDHEF